MATAEDDSERNVVYKYWTAPDMLSVGRGQGQFVPNQIVLRPNFVALLNFQAFRLLDFSTFTLLDFSSFKLVHAIYRDFLFSEEKNENFNGKHVTFLIYLLKPYIVGTPAG